MLPFHDGLVLKDFLAAAVGTDECACQLFQQGQRCVEIGLKKDLVALFTAKGCTDSQHHGLSFTLQICFVIYFFRNTILESDLFSRE